MNTTIPLTDPFSDPFSTPTPFLQPFGTLLGQSGYLADANVYRFSSKGYVASCGVYYYGYRFYEPSLQRWLNRDPIGDRGGINLYNYVANNPVNSIDPLGLLVTAVLDTTANTLTVTDDDTGKSITVRRSQVGT